MSLMLVNPAPRRKHRTAAQRAATKRMVAANRSRRASNPSRKRRASSKRRVVRHHNPIFASAKRRVRHVRRRRNPISLKGGNLGGMLMTGLKGAGGAIVVNAAASFLPATFNTGTIGYVIRVALSLAMGTFGGKLGRDMAEGSLAVTLHDAVNNFIGASLPGSTLHGYLSGGGMNAGSLTETDGRMSGYMSSAVNNNPGRVMDSELAQMQYR